MAKNLEISVLLDVYGEMLTEKQRAITGYYYDDDLSLAEIAENEGVTRQAVRDVIHRTELQLVAFEERLHFAGRTRCVNETVQRLYELAAGEDGVWAQEVRRCCDGLMKEWTKEE